MLTKALDVITFETHARVLLNAREESTTIWDDLAQEFRCVDAGRYNYDRAIRTIDGSSRGILLSSRRGCSGSDNFRYFSRTVMHSRRYLSGAGAA